MVKNYDVSAALDNAAKLIHDYDSNPITWQSWIKYFLSQLQEQAYDANPSNQERYKELLANLLDVIHNRQQTGGW